MCVVFVCIYYVYHMSAWFHQKPEKGVKSFWAGVVIVTDSCEPPRGCRGPSGPLQEQQVLLATEPLLQPPFYFCLCLVLPLS